MRFRLARFERAQVRGNAGKSVIDGRGRICGIHRLAARLEAKIQVHRMMDLVAPGRVGQRHFLERIDVKLNAVPLLAGRGAQRGKC